MTFLSFVRFPIPSVMILVFCLNWHTSHAQNPDINILRDINIHRNPALDETFKSISKSMFPVSVSVPLIMTSVGLIKKDKQLTHNGLETGASLIMATVITFGTKYAVNRNRPYVDYPELQNLSAPKDPSFPSGHTSSSFAIATSLSLQYKKWYVVVPAYTWASGVAYSRLHMGVHYPSDVLAGALIGAGSAFLCHKGQQWLNKKRK